MHSGGPSESVFYFVIWCFNVETTQNEEILQSFGVLLSKLQLVETAERRKDPIVGTGEGEQAEGKQPHLLPRTGVTHR